MNAAVQSIRKICVSMTLRCLIWHYTLTVIRQYVTAADSIRNALVKSACKKSCERWQINTFNCIYFSKEKEEYAINCDRDRVGERERHTKKIDREKSTFCE